MALNPPHTVEIEQNLRRILKLDIVSHVFTNVDQSKKRKCRSVEDGNASFGWNGGLLSLGFHLTLTEDEMRSAGGLIWSSVDWTWTWASWLNTRVFLIRTATAFSVLTVSPRFKTTPIFKFHMNPLWIIYSVNVAKIASFFKRVHSLLCSGVSVVCCNMLFPPQRK